MRSSSHRCRNRGFTLIELLVVIAIIAILVGILIPTLSVANRQAKNLVCQSGLRQVALAFHVYAGLFKDVVPAPNSFYLKPARQVPWQVFLWTYVSKKSFPTDAELVAGKHAYLLNTVFVCPRGVFDTATGDYASLGYAMNENLPGIPSTALGPTTVTQEFKKLSKVRDGSKTLLVSDGNNVNVSYQTAGDKDSIVAPTGNVFDVVAHPRHQDRHQKGRVQIAMVDGSVTSRVWIFSKTEIPVPPRGNLYDPPATLNGDVREFWLGTR